LRTPSFSRSGGVMSAMETANQTMVKKVDAMSYVVSSQEALHI
jgi:hypothetical protein